MLRSLLNHTVYPFLSFFSPKAISFDPLEHKEREEKDLLLLIGSRALYHYFPDANQEEIRKLANLLDEPSQANANDWDFITTEKKARELLKSWAIKGKVEYKEEFLPFHSDHCPDIEKDLRGWIHLDKIVLGEEAFAKLKKIKGILKIRGVFICDKQELPFEIEIASEGTSAALLLDLAASLELQQKDDYVIASKEMLEAIKTSHIIFPDAKQFFKHMSDLHVLRKVIFNNFDCDRKLELEKIMITRRLEHCLMRGVPGAHINLNQSNETFLDDEGLLSDTFMKHDTIHELVQLHDSPAYFNLRVDKTKAKIDKHLFDSASLETRLNCIREEAMVIALERYLLPGIEKKPHIAYLKALIRICTTLTKGWFREWSIDAFPQIYTLPKDIEAIAHKILYLNNEKQCDTISQYEVLLQQQQQDNQKNENKQEENKQEENKQEENKQEENKQEENKQEENKVMVSKPSFPVNYVLQFAHARKFSFRRDNVPSIIFRHSPNECNLANQLAKATEEVDTNIYHCVFRFSEKEILDFYFSADSTRVHEEGGWCENYYKWAAYITAADPDTYKRVGNRGMIIKYDDSYSESYGVLKSHVRLALHLCLSSDGSSWSRPELHPSVQSLDDITQQVSHPLITSSFLVRFMLCMSYPARSKLPISVRTSEHFLYDLWRIAMNKNNRRPY